MVVIPFVSDQPVNAQQVARLGLGRVLDCKSITPQVLKETAFAVLSDKGIPEAIRSIQEELTHAPGNRGAVTIIEEYALRKEPSSCPTLQ